ncbi:MAG TPA: fatty acyl-AMP ligase [Desulfohalobiaceae bacterium]|nr:fatty acyl-AMP ligase [Desulfohalobiaceae bacterium]
MNDGFMEATLTGSSLDQCKSDFSTLQEALDNAAKGNTGINFYERGYLNKSITYTDLQGQAMELANRLYNLELERGSLVAIIADTHPDFHRFFFACQYAGLIPVPLPFSLRLGSRKGNVQQLKKLLEQSGATLVMAPEHCLPLLDEVVDSNQILMAGSLDTFSQIPLPSQGSPQPLTPSEPAYLQYSSGSTRDPHGMIISQQAVLNNLAGILEHGICLRQDDRFHSWLPFYHDMGLVGFVLGSIVAQVSVDYQSPLEFAMRPGQWLSLMSQNQATISFAPPFGYELCARRLRQRDVSKFDLSLWRIAGVGAETIRPDPLDKFAELLASCGFDKRAFTACYGLAECSLAVSFSPLKQGISVDSVDGDTLSESNQALPVRSKRSQSCRQVASFVNCGQTLPGLEVQVRDCEGSVLPDRCCGRLFVRGKSLMNGYYNRPEETKRVFDQDGWLNTGDVGYKAGESIFITGRETDMILINGRNIWPHDLEAIAERQHGISPNDTLAFSVSDAEGRETAVIVVQVRTSDISFHEDIKKDIGQGILDEFGISCLVDLVPPHTLPRTSSGKPSRVKARQQFLERSKQKGTEMFEYFYPSKNSLSETENRCFQ